MRICSLVPAATEVLFALGLGDDVVGVTHECDWPPEAAAKPVVTASLIQTGDLTSAEIDRLVAATALGRRPLYAIDEERWAEVEADVVVMQELCEVCAVSTDQVEGVLRARPLEVEVLDFSPSTHRRASARRSARSARGSAPRERRRSSPPACAAASTGSPRRSRASSRRRASS